MDRKKNFFDKIASLIPGYKGYAERDGRRNCDGVLRDSITNCLLEVEKKIDSIMFEALSNKDKTKLRGLELIRKKVNTISSKIRYAPYGATAFFSDVKIKEDELEKIYMFDLEMQLKTNEIQKLVLSNSVDGLNELLIGLENELVSRNNYINEFKL